MSVQENNVATLDRPHQIVMAGDSARARRSDPVSSHVAADRSQRSLDSVRRAVLDLVAQLGFANGAELNDMYSLYQGLRGWPRVSWDSPRKRAGELAADGLLEVTNPDCPRGTPRIYKAVQS